MVANVKDIWTCFVRSLVWVKRESSLMWALTQLNTPRDLNTLRSIVFRANRVRAHRSLVRLLVNPVDVLIAEEHAFVSPD
jgi:hypothetical protein